MNQRQNSYLRIFLRTLAALLLFTIIIINFKASIQAYSVLSLANTMNKIDENLLSSSGLIFDLVYFLLINLVILVTWSIFIVISIVSPLLKLKSGLESDLYWIIVVFLNITFAVALNSYLYPTSLVSYLRHSPLTEPSILTIMAIGLLVLFFRGLLSLISLKTLTVTSSILTVFLLYPWLTVEKKQDNTSNKPNIIILGIDGLRPDHLAYYEADKKLAPNLNRLLESFKIYKYAYTPQGRTYVAWMSLLTGLYPINNNVRFNLAPPETINKEIPVVNILKKEGYFTSYAIDERRFNQIDNSYGFDNIVGPKIGVADAIIAGFGDLPYLNILLQHPYSSYLLPYLYNNRAYGKAYSPSRFNETLVDSLDLTKPNFLSVHLCQLHWPYTSKVFIDSSQADWDGNYNHYMYKQMLKNVDTQVQGLFYKLSRKGLLENAIVYIISDHGESFNQNKYSANLTVNTSLPKTKSWGHGTNILDQQQSHVLLAQAKFKHNKVVSTPNVYQGNYSLIDIVPSIFKNLKVPYTEFGHLDGIPLPQEIEEEDQQRFIFVESSLPVKSINKSFIDKQEVMSETASHYELRDDGRAYMKLESYTNLVAKKQRGVYFKGWQLTMLPTMEELVLYNRKTNNIYTTDTYKGNFNWQSMLTALCMQYKNDFGFSKKEACLLAVQQYTGQTKDKHSDG